MQTILTNTGQALIANTINNAQLLQLSSYTVADGIYTFSGSENNTNGIPQFIGTDDLITWYSVVSTDNDPISSQNYLRIGITIPANPGITFNIGNIMIFATDDTNTVYPFAIIALDNVIVSTGNKISLYGIFNYTGIANCFDNTVQTNTSSILSSVFQENQVWLDMASATDDVINRNIVSPRNQLALIRDPNYENRITQLYTGQMLGLQFFSDSFTNDVIDRVVRFIEIYYPKKGTPEFINFLSFLKNTQFTIEQLWTPDYSVFVTHDNIPTGGTDITTQLFGAQITATLTGSAVSMLNIINAGFGGTPGTYNLTFSTTNTVASINATVNNNITSAVGNYTVGSNGQVASVHLTSGGSGYTVAPNVTVNPGAYYPTSQVVITYDAGEFPTEGSETDISNLFYVIAPIHLVLKYFIAYLTVTPVTLYLAPISREVEFDVSIGVLQNEATVYFAGDAVDREVAVSLTDIYNVAVLYVAGLCQTIEVDTFVITKYVDEFNIAWTLNTIFPDGRSPLHCTFIRNSPGWALVNGSYLKYINNTVRYVYSNGICNGLLIEQATQNLFVDPLNPVAQSIYLTANIPYTFTVLGTGALFINTGSGITSVYQASPWVFIPMVSGNYSVSPSYLSFIQCERGTVATTPLLSSLGSELQRAPELLTLVSNPLKIIQGTIIIGATKTDYQTSGIAVLYSIGNTVTYFMLYLNTANNNIMLRVCINNNVVYDTLITTIVGNNPLDGTNNYLVVALSWNANSISAACAEHFITLTLTNFAGLPTTNINVGCDQSDSNFWNGIINYLYSWPDPTSVTKLLLYT